MSSTFHFFYTIENDLFQDAGRLLPNNTHNNKARSKRTVIHIIQNPGMPTVDRNSKLIAKFLKGYQLIM